MSSYPKIVDTCWIRAFALNGTVTSRTDVRFHVACSDRRSRDRVFVDSAHFNINRPITMRYARKNSDIHCTVRFVWRFTRLVHRGLLETTVHVMHLHLLQKLYLTMQPGSPSKWAECRCCAMHLCFGCADERLEEGDRFICLGQICVETKRTRQGRVPSSFGPFCPN
jgi:hypothetical protein